MIDISPSVPALTGVGGRPKETDLVKVTTGENDSFPRTSDLWLTLDLDAGETQSDAIKPTSFNIESE